MDEGTFLQPLLGDALPWLYADTLLWTGIGLIGNALFSSRFLYQWLHSEKKRKLLVPPAFWYISFWGSTIALLYAVHIDKLPIILGYCFMPFIYARNISLLRRGEREGQAESALALAPRAPATLEKLNLEQAFAGVTETWKPQLALRVQDMELKLTKLQGEFVWHQHEQEDELFLVHRGSLRIELRDGAVDLAEGEAVVIPRGVEHRPIAAQEAEVILLETVGTRQYGNAEGPKPSG